MSRSTDEFSKGVRFPMYVYVWLGWCIGTIRCLFLTTLLLPSCSFCQHNIDTKEDSTETYVLNQAIYRRTNASSNHLSIIHIFTYIRSIYVSNKNSGNKQPRYGHQRMDEGIEQKRNVIFKSTPCLSINQPYIPSIPKENAGEVHSRDNNVCEAVYRGG